MSVKLQRATVIQSALFDCLATSLLVSVHVSEGCQDDGRETSVSLTSKRGVAGRTCNRCDVGYEQSRSAVAPCVSKSSLHLCAIVFLL